MANKVGAKVRAWILFSISPAMALGACHLTVRVGPWMAWGAWVVAMLIMSLFPVAVDE
jgi:hypothetical protein